MAISVVSIHIYPVKALGAISLAESIVEARGLQHDRRFMVIDQNHEFLTQRDHPRMATVWVEIENDKVILSAPGTESISFALTPKVSTTRTVKVWSSHVRAQTVTAGADQWLSDYLGVDARLVYMPESTARRIHPAYAKNAEIVSFADGFPLLITSDASLNDLNTRIKKNGGQALSMNRFRPNLVISGCDAYAEDRLGDIAVGNALFRAVKPCTRCQVTTIDQANGQSRGPEPLQTLGTYRNSPSGVVFGMNLIPLTPDTVRVGDEVNFCE